MSPKPYKLELTEEDITTIAWVGNRYGWSSMLLKELTGIGENRFSELQGYRLRQAFESDMEGGHAAFPLLDGHCELYQKLMQLWESFV